MADFTHRFWDLCIGLITIASILGCGILLWSQAAVRVQAGSHSDGTTGHLWDEDLTELNTPLPRWWMWLFYLTIVFSLGYLFLYPGLGSYAGSLGWQSAGAYKAELAKAGARYDPLFAGYAKEPIELVARDPKALMIGERLFLTYCAGCHGSDARGNKGYPNLTDNDWLHGGSAAAIKASIMRGRTGVMPSMAAALGSEQDVRDVANYVRSLSGAPADPIRSAFGKTRFGACVACPGPGGQGNQAMGAPNLSDKVWLYGGSQEAIMETIRKGRTNAMPAFDDFLGEGKVHVLTAYVWSLSAPPVVAQQ